MDYAAVGLGEWAQGGLGAPALVGFLQGSDGMPRWELLTDATNVPRDNASLAHVGFSIGGSIAVGEEPSAWAARRSGRPLMGENPPTCSGEPRCESQLSFRDPTLLATPTVRPGETMIGAVALEKGSSRDLRDRFDLHGFALTLNASSTVALQETPVLSTDDVDCHSLRDPLLLAGSGANPSITHWLLYTCVDATSAKRIDAVGLERQPDDALALRTEPFTVVEGSLGDEAHGPEAVAADGGAMHLWYLRRARGKRSVSYAIVSETAGGRLQAADYPANPVLSGSDAVVGPCEPPCEILGLAAARNVATPSRVRLLAHRRSANGHHDLIQLQQVLP